MDGIIVSDAYKKLKDEAQKLQLILAALTSERDDLRYHICPELTARYAREIGDYQNRLNYQKMMIMEMKRRIEIARAALNREKTVSQEEVDEQINEEYKDFHEKVNEEFEKAEQAKKEQREKEARQQEYEKRWQEQYGNSASDDTDSDETGKEDSTGDGESAGRDDDNHDSDNSQSDSGDGSSEEEREQASAKGGSKVPNAKELYRKIIKKLHPDMNPDITEHEKDLFNRAVKAYQDGDIATLQEIYDEVFGDGTADALKKELTYDELVELRDKLNARIAQVQDEIDQIKQEFPYLMKDFLDNECAVKQKQAELEEQIHQNEETLKRLTEMLEEINQEMEELRQKQARKHQ